MNKFRSSDEDPLKESGEFSRPLPAPGSLLKPRLKHAATSGTGPPPGSTYAPPRADPLPSRGSGFLLALTIASATIAVIFAVLLAIKV